MTRNKNPSALANWQSDNKKDKPNRSEYIIFRVTSDEKMAILSYANRYGHSPSDYCRKCCLKRKMVNMSDEARKERRFFIQMVNNWNQIARHFNTEGANPDTMAELEQFLADIKRHKQI